MNDQTQEILDVAAGRRPVMLAMEAEDLLKMFVVLLAAVFIGGILVALTMKNFK